MFDGEGLGKWIIKLVFFWAEAEIPRFTSCHETFSAWACRRCQTWCKSTLLKSHGLPYPVIISKRCPIFSAIKKNKQLPCIFATRRIAQEHRNLVLSESFNISPSQLLASGRRPPQPRSSREGWIWRKKIPRRCRATRGSLTDPEGRSLCSIHLSPFKSQSFKIVSNFKIPVPTYTII